jgi:hypothetical protein
MDLMDRVDSRIGFREIALQAGLLVLALAAVFPGTFLRGEMIAPGDILFRVPPWSHYAPADYQGFKNRTLLDFATVFYPLYAISKDSVQQGEWPLWNPLELSGMPLLADYQSAVFYPFRVLQMLFDLAVATTLFLLLKLWLCGMAAYICARGIRLSRGVACIFSLGWMLGSYNLLWCYWPLTDVAAWLPILFLAVEWILEGRYRKGFYLFLAGGTMMMLAGHPETAFTMNLGLGLYFLVRLGLDQRRGKALAARIGVLAGAWAAILLVCAAQLLPFIEYLPNSFSFAWHDQFSTVFHWPVRALVNLWAPRYFLTSAPNRVWGFDIPYYAAMMYMGILPWLGLGLLACKAPASWPHRRRVLALLLSALPGFLLPLNPPALGWVAALPVFRSIFLVYYAAFALFAIPLLGALGLERWFARPRRFRELGYLALTIVPGALFVGITYRLDASLMRGLKIDREVAAGVAVPALMLALSLVVFFASCRVRRPKLALGILAAILAGDLVGAVYGLQVTAPREWLYPATRLTDYLRALKPPCRIAADFGGIPVGALTCYGIEEQMGYDGIYPARMMHLQRALGADLWKAFEPAYATEYYLSDAQYPPLFPVDRPGYFEKITELDGIEVYRNLRALPRAYLADQMEVVPDTKTLYERMRQPDWDPAHLVLTDTPPATPFDSGAQAMGEQEPGHASGTAEVMGHRYTRVTVNVNAMAPAILVLADAYYPGWKAYVDGRDEPIFPAYHVSRGVIVPAGNHVVEFRYAPASFRIGLWISTATLLAAAGIAAIHGLRRPRT